MKHDITVELSTSGINRLVAALEEYKSWVGRKAQEFIDRLAQEGYQIASFYFQIAQYDGENDSKVTVEPQGELCTAVVATGNAVLFIEFGAGMYLGYGHPEPGEFGPGTYPGKGHWDDPKGWYLPKAVKEATGIDHSIGNAPAMPMYNAVKELEMNLQKIANEVFR